MKRPSVEILLQNSGESTIFKTDDIIQGEVIFTPHHATRVEHINISFQGSISNEDRAPETKAKTA